MGGVAGKGHRLPNNTTHDLHPPAQGGGEHRTDGRNNRLKTREGKGRSRPVCTWTLCLHEEGHTYKTCFQRKRFEKQQQRDRRRDKKRKTTSTTQRLSPSSSDDPNDSNDE